MNNFPVNVEGKEYWISRSVAVVAFIYRYNGEGQLQVLAVKRGKGCPDHVGEWCCPCGYLDYNETCEEAVLREIWEETGVSISNVEFMGINSRPEGRQNVTIRYKGWLSNDDIVYLTNAHSEPNEVEEIAWIPVDKIHTYKWAFDHDRLILLYV